MDSPFLDSLVRVISSVTRGVMNIVPAVSRSLGKALGGLSKGLSVKGLGGDLGKSLFSILGKFVSVSKGIINAIGEAANPGGSRKDIGGGACENLCKNITETINQCINNNLSKTSNNVSNKASNESVEKDISKTTTEGTGDKAGGGFLGNLGKVLLKVIGKFFSFGISKSTSKESSETGSEDISKTISEVSGKNRSESVSETLSSVFSGILSRVYNNTLGKVLGRVFRGRASVSQDKGSSEVAKEGSSETPGEGSENIGKTLAKSVSSVLSGVTKVVKSFVGAIGNRFIGTISKVYSSILGESTKSISRENYSSTEGKQSSSTSSKIYISTLFKGISETLGGFFTKITSKENKTTTDKDSGKLGQPDSLSAPKDIDTRAFDVIKRLFVSLGKVTKPLQLGIKGLISVFRVASKTFLVSTRVGESLVILGVLLAKAFTGILSSASSLVSGLASLPSSISNASSKIGSIGSTILDTFTGIPGQLQSAFSGAISMIKSYSPAEAKQIEIAFGRLRATIGQVLAPIAPMISNIVLNVARIIKDSTSQIDIKGVFKWIVFFMSLTIGTVIAGIKLLVVIIRKLRGGLQGGFQGILSVISSLLGKAIQIVVKLLGWLLRQLPTWLSMLPRYLLQFISWLLTQLPDWLKTLSEYLVELIGDLLIGLGKAIVEYLPQLGNEIVNLLSSILVFVKKAFWNFVYGIPDMFSKLGTMIWNALKSALPGWIKRRLGISDSSEQAQPQQQGVSLKQLSTPEGIMKGAESFFKGIGLDEVGSVFGDMSNMFSRLFEKPDDSDLPFEAGGVTTGSIEDLGKKAREAALGVSGDPQKVTAESSKQTSDNTKAIRDSMQLLVTNNANEDIARMANEASKSNKAIQVLNKTNEERVDIDRREKLKLEMSIDEMVYQQQKTNRILMRMAYGQKEMVEMERQKNFGYNR